MQAAQADAPAAENDPRAHGEQDEAPDADE